MNAQLTDRVQRSFSRSFLTYHDSAGQQARIADRLGAGFARLGRTAALFLGVGVRLRHRSPDAAALRAFRVRHAHGQRPVARGR